MTSIGPYVGKLKRQLQTREEQESPLNAARIEEAWGRAGPTWRACFWTPAVTVLTFLRQVLHGNCSCRQAVAMTLAQAISQQLAQGGGRSDSMSGEPGAYSQARQHLPQSVFEEVNQSVSATSWQEVGQERMWCGRRVAVVDGSSASTSDTPQLQKAFPQPKSQRKGCGFPVIRLAELNLRSLKTTLKMETLRCQSVDMVGKELLMYQLTYNLIRLLMWEAARRCGGDVRRLSFAGTQQRIVALWPYGDRCPQMSQRQRLADWLLEQIALHALPDRPNRKEPRAIKRRHKVFPYLKHPREIARMMPYYQGLG